MRGRIYKNSENFMGAEGGGSGSGGGANVGDIIAVAGEVGSAIFTALSEQKNAKLRAQYEANLAELSAQDQKSFK